LLSPSIEGLLALVFAMVSRYQRKEPLTVENIPKNCNCDSCQRLRAWNRTLSIAAIASFIFLIILTIIYGQFPSH